MEKSLYTKNHVAERAATGALGSFAAQVNFGTQFASSGRFSLQGNREFDTYVNALAYANSHMSAFPGIILTVSDDTDPKKNGAYLVEHDHDTISDANPNGLKLTKLAQGGEAQEKLEWTKITDDEIPVDPVPDENGNDTE